MLRFHIWRQLHRAAIANYSEGLYNKKSALHVISDGFSVLMLAWGLGMHKWQLIRILKLVPKPLPLEEGDYSSV